MYDAVWVVSAELNYARECGLALVVQDGARKCYLVIRGSDVVWLK